jgi:hypothetical protein
MANKVVRVSDDAGVNWHKLPGNSAELSNEAEQTPDSVFGQTYESNEAGLITWAISANAYFKGFAGYLAKIMKTTASNAMTTEATTLESTRIYRITNAARRIMNRAVATVVFDNAVDHTADIEWIDYLFGRVKFKDSYTVTGAVTITGAYFTTAQLGKGRSYTLTMTDASVDNTDFATAQANSGHRTFEPGMRTVALEMGGVFDINQALRAAVVARSEVIIEIDPAGNGQSIARGFFKLVNDGQSGDVGALEEETVNAVLTVPAVDILHRPFGWLHTSTTLSTSVQKCLNAWLNRTSIRVQYLPNGTTGGSPLDGVDGTAVISDMSLSGGLSDMNTFTVDFQGSGALTAV